VTPQVIRVAQSIQLNQLWLEHQPPVVQQLKTMTLLNSVILNKSMSNDTKDKALGDHQPMLMYLKVGSRRVLSSNLAVIGWTL